MKLMLGAALIGLTLAGTAHAEDPRIHLAMLQPPRSGLNPLTDDAFKLSRWSTAETLIRLNANGEPQPFLATAWTRVDDHNWRFVIRQGVKFHDGSDLTPERVVASLTAATKAVPMPRILNGIKLTARTDGDAVIVQTDNIDPLLPNRLSSPQLAILAERAYQPDGTVIPTEAGTGPFELTRIEGVSSAHLDRFDGYWGDRAKLSGIDADYVGDGTARGAALRTQSADIVEAVPVSQAALIDPDLIHEVPMPRTNTLYLNTKNGPLADPALRAAVRGAVDRAAIVRTVYEGRADEARGLLGPALPWADGLRTTPAQGATGQPNGAQITIGTFTDRAELPEVAVLIAQQLTAAGFVVKQDVREYAHIEADALAGAFDIFILSRATMLDSGDPVAYMVADFSCAGSFNISQLCDPTVEEALTKAALATPGADRRRAIMDAEAAILATNGAIPLLHERVMQGEQKGVANAERDPRERMVVTEHTTLAE